MSTQTIYPALLPLWKEMQKTIDKVHAQRLRLNQPPRVCFVGRFKTGKSRLINAIVGEEDILPYNTDECTAQLVELAYGDEDKATQLTSLDLDFSSEHPIELLEFKEAVDLTAMHGNKKRTAEAAAFRRYLPSSFLKTVNIVDTPGFDGPNHEARKRADQVREQAIQQSTLCVLVLGKPLGEDDLKCIRLITQYGIQLVVVLNKTDECEDVQEALNDIKNRLAEETGHQPSLYPCSALWQMASDQERQRITEWRFEYAEEEDEIEWHQWDALVKRLARPLSGENHIALLKTIHRAFDLALQVHEEYDQTQQAEAAFLEDLPRWQKIMPSLIGKTVLEMAVSAARNGKSLPWKRLQNFGITPQMIAPESILPLSELKQLTELYLKTLSPLKQLAMIEHSVALYRFFLSDVASFITGMENNIKTSSDLVSFIKSNQEDALWYSQPWRKDFTYAESFGGLQRRWKTRPTVMDDDCTRIRQRLAAALV